MNKITLKPEQEEAVNALSNGSVLYGMVGSGKSLTSLVYYIRLCGGKEFTTTEFTRPLDLYIITPANKRDLKEWEKEFVYHYLPLQKIKIVVDSWNNITKYTSVKNAFFIFDEQKVIGSGTWAKSFLKIAKSNQFIVLTATPGDVWTDYIPIFVANGFYKDRYSFLKEHVVYNPYLPFPKIMKYLNEDKLLYYKNKVLVRLEKRSGIKVMKKEKVYVDYDEKLFNEIVKSRWNPWKNEIISTTADLYYCLRKAVNLNVNRLNALKNIHDLHTKIILFYNFDYELYYLKNNLECTVTEYNGHRHDAIPDSGSWIHLVQYSSGAEAWNCIQTNTIVFWSLTYSYKAMVQAAGRIDRMNSPFDILYYFNLVTNSQIDNAILESLDSKKDFNEKEYHKKHGI